MSLMTFAFANSLSVYFVSFETYTFHVWSIPVTGEEEKPA